MNIFECDKGPIEELDEYVEVEFVDVLTEESTNASALGDNIHLCESIRDKGILRNNDQLDARTKQQLGKNAGHDRTSLRRLDFWNPKGYD